MTAFFVVVSESKIWLTNEYSLDWESLRINPYNCFHVNDMTRTGYLHGAYSKVVKGLELKRFEPGNRLKASRCQ